MTEGLPLYLRDHEAYHAGLAEGNRTQPRKRVCADALIRDEAGRILLVDPAYKPSWDLPGGMAGANEPPDRCVLRELREELGLDVPPGPVLAVDWVPPHGEWDDMIAFVFDGGVMPHSTPVRLLDGELSAVGWYTPEMASRMLPARTWRRAEAALTALGKGTALYLSDGYPAGLAPGGMLFAVRAATA